MTYV